jgi:type II secretion system protein N
MSESPQPVISPKALMTSSSLRKPLRRFAFHFSALLLFVIFFAGTALVYLPKDQLRDHVVGLIARQTGYRIAIGEFWLSPLLKAEARNIVWQPDNQEWPPVVVDSLTLSPIWTSLFGENKSVRAHAEVTGGTIDSRCAQNGSCETVFTDVSLAPFFAAQFPFPLSGKTGGSVIVEQRENAGFNSAAFDLAIDDLQVAGLNTLGLAEAELPLGRLRLRGKLTGQTLSIEEMQNDGGDLSLACHGTIMVSEFAERCLLNLRISLRPKPELEKTLGDLLLLVGVKADPEGSYTFRLTGTLARPKIR